LQPNKALERTPYGRPLSAAIALAKRTLKIEEINEDCQSFYQARLDRLRD
jgi:hypothetical protein